MAFEKGHKINQGKKYSIEHKKKISISHFGIKPSDETRKKLRFSHLGVTPSIETKIKMSLSNTGEGNPFFGKKHSEETRKKMKESRKNQIFSNETLIKKSISMKGKNSKEKHGGWKGGITLENKLIRSSVEFRLWRESVFARDGWICKKCLIKGGNLHPHHILNFAEYRELRFAIDNGITLCKSCHSSFHKKYGQRKNNREQLLEFLTK